jgi:hypothetical protein
VIDVSPLRVLGLRWYASALESVPAGVQAAPLALMTRYKNAGVAARFAVGSDPTDSGTSESITSFSAPLDRGKPVDIASAQLLGASGLEVRGIAPGLRVEARSFTTWGECEVASVPGP